MNCNNCTNNNALKEVKIKHVHGNVLRMAIPLTLRTIELVDGEINATDTPFIPSSEHPVKVVFSKGSVSVALDATMKDGNIAYIEEKGKIPVGTYAITVTCNDDNGNPYRFKQNAVLYVADATIEAGIEETIEYEVTTWYLDAAIFLALKGEDGVGIYDIDTQSSGEIGGVNTVTFILTDGRTRSFNVLNGSGAVDSDLDIDSQSPIANSAVTAKFNELSGELADLFGDVDYDTSSKSIRFWDKGKTNVLASLDARPFIKDGMVSNAYISNNTLVITFNTDSGKEAIGVPLTTVFNPNNYYTKTQVDSRIASAIANINLSNYYTKSQTDTMVSRITPYEVTFTTGNNSNIVCDHTIANIYQNYTNHKPIIAKYGESVGTLVYIKGGENPEAAFLFGDRHDSPYLLRNGVSGWGKEELGADIEVEPWPSIESDKPVASDGVAAALAQKVSSVTINGTTKTPDEDGDVSFTVEGGSGGYEPPVGGIPKSDLAQSVQDTLDDVSNKVDKVTGKGLSTEDYTTTEKQKLAGLSNYDDTAIQAEVDAKYEKPSTGIPKTDLSSDVQASLGKADTALQSQVQSDWNENDTSDPAYIANKPTIPEAQVNSDWNASSGVAQILNKPTIPTVPTNVSAFTNDAGYLTQHQDISGKANSADLAAVATSGDYEDLANTPDIPTVPTNVSAFTNDAGYLTSHQSLSGYATESYVSTTIADLVDSAPQTLDTLKELADALGDDPNFATTMATQLGNKVDKETGKSLMTDAERTKLQGIAAGAEVNVQPNWTQTNTSADDYIKNKPTLATVATSGSYNDLQDKPTIPAAYDDTTLSGRVSALENAGFITTETDPTVPAWAKASTKPTYTAQEVGALPSTTTIPTDLGDLTNNAGYTKNTGTITGITMNGVSKGTSGVVDLGTVITEHQSLSAYATTSAMNTALAGKQDTLTFDTTPTANSNNVVKSGGVKQAIEDKLTEVSIAAISETDAKFFIRDGALCISTENFVVVTTVPSISKVVNSDGTATITITHSNNSAIIEYSLDGGTTWQTYNTALTINTAGTHTIKARAQVSGSPMSDIVTDTVTLVSSAMPTLSVSKTSSDVTLTASGSGTVVMTVDGTAQTSPYTINRGSDSQTLAVVVTNKEANKLIATLTQSVVVPKVTVISQKIQDFCTRVTTDGGSLIWGDAETTQEKYDEHTLLLGSEPELDFLGYKGTKSAPTYLYSVNENCDANSLSAVYINDDGLIVASESKVGYASANIRWTKYTGTYSTRFAPDITYNGDSRTVNRDFTKLYMSAANGFLNADSTVTNAYYYNCLFGGIFNVNATWRRVGNQDGVLGVFSGENSDSIGCYNSTGMTSFKIDRSVTPMTVEINGAAATSVSATYSCGSRNRISHAYMQMKENSPLLVLAY